MWGQGLSLCFEVLPLGIIPTRVGTSSLYISALPSVRDHPHACGDKFLTKTGYLPDEGSSPRVWGQVIDELGELEIEGIIPTRVGTRKGKRKKPYYR